MHLIYSLASPSFLATPPLLSCANSASTIVHHSATRLAAQNAAAENDRAHEVSETLAREWAVEAKKAAQALDGTRASSKPAHLKNAMDPPAQRVRPPSYTEWSHLYCSHLDVRGVYRTRGAPLQVHLLVTWLDGFEFSVHLRRWGRLQFRLTVHIDATASVGYPTYRLTNKIDGSSSSSSGRTDRGTGSSSGGGEGGSSQAAKQTSGSAPRELEEQQPILSAKTTHAKGRPRSKKGHRKRLHLAHSPSLSSASHSDGDAADGGTAATRAKRKMASNATTKVDAMSAMTNGKPSEPGSRDAYVSKYAEPGWSRLPLVRGGSGRLTLRLTAAGVELYCEGVFLEAQPWGNGSMASAAGSWSATTSSTSTSATTATTSTNKEGSAYPISRRASAHVPSTLDAVDFSAAVVLPSPTKLFFAWQACAEAAAGSEASASLSTDHARSHTARRSSSLKHTCYPAGRRTWTATTAIAPPRISAPCTAHMSTSSGSGGDHGQTVADRPLGGTSHSAAPASSRVLEWRKALQLGVASQPLLLPALGSSESQPLQQPRFIRYPKVRCANEVVLDPSVVAHMQEQLAVAEDLGVEGFSAKDFSAKDLGATVTPTDCATQCASLPSCIGYRVDRRVRSPPHCVMIQGLHSRRASDCDLVKLRRPFILQPTMPVSAQTLALPESTRVIRKPFREAVGFGAGDALSIRGKRTHLSNVPTKVVFSSLPEGDEDRGREAHLAFYIGWKRKRTWISTNTDGKWGGEHPVHGAGTARAFPFRLGELFALNFTRASTRMTIVVGGETVATVEVGSASGVHAGAPSRLVNQISIMGSVIEHAVIAFGRTRWRTFQASACANEAIRRRRADGGDAIANETAQGSSLLEPIEQSLGRSWSECRDACLAAAITCTGFAFVKASLEPATATGDGQGLCRLQGLLLTTAISACEIHEADSWDLNLRLREAPTRWYNVAMVAPDQSPSGPATTRSSATRSISHATMPCVLRESTYSYCGNPLVLTREATDHLMENLYGAWWLGTCTLEAAPAGEGAPSELRVSDLTRVAIDGALSRLGLVPELATEDLVLLRCGPCALSLDSARVPLELHCPPAAVMLCRALRGAWPQKKLSHLWSSAGRLAIARYQNQLLAVASLIEIKSRESSARRANQARRPFLFDVRHPSNGTALVCDNVEFKYWVRAHQMTSRSITTTLPYLSPSSSSSPCATLPPLAEPFVVFHLDSHTQEKNWMPFEHEGRLLAVRWFSPHMVVEIFPASGTCTQLHVTPHGFAAGVELHGGTPPLRFDSGHYLTLVRLRTGSWVGKKETRNYANLLYLFEAKPPFAVVRVSLPFTLPSCVQSQLHMRIQVAKSLVEVAGGYLLCWGELDCYSCCATLPPELILDLLRMPSPSQTGR